MSLFTARAVIYLRRQLLEMYNLSGGLIQTVTYPSEIVANEEILDRAKFVQLIKNSLTERAGIPEYEATLVLSEELLFQKTFSTGSPEETKPEAEAFYSEIPFAAEKLVKKEINLGRETRLIATNKEVFTVIKEVLQSAGWKVKAIIPVTLVNDFSRGEGLNPGDIKHILKSNFLVKDADFLTADGADISPAVAYRQLPEENNKLLFLLLALVSIAAGFTVTWFVSRGKIPQINKFLPQKSAGAPAAKPTATKETKTTPVSTPSAAFKKKAELKILVLNGSGVIGQAGLVKKNLTSLGFTNIEVGDAPQEKNTTTADFSAQVSYAERSEITKELKKEFTEVTEQVATASAEDVLIITGK